MVEVETVSFVPLVATSRGEMTRECSKFYCRLRELIAYTSSTYRISAYKDYTQETSSNDQ